MSSSRLHARAMPLTLVLLALCCYASAAHAVVEMEAAGSGFVSGDNAKTRLAMNVTEQPMAGGRSASGSHSLVIESATTVFAVATISGSSFAAPGVVKARIDGLAYVAPVAPNIPTISNGTPVAAGNFYGKFEDTVLLSSATLPAGTPVQFVYTVDLHATSNGVGHAGPQFGGYDQANFYFHYFLHGGSAYIDRFNQYPTAFYQTVPKDASLRFPFTVSGVIGETVSLGAAISLGADDRAGWYGEGSGGDLTWYGELQETHLDASNTARFNLDAVTPGLDLIAESGHNYATTAVPEPGSWILLVLGLGVQVWTARRTALC